MLKELNSIFFKKKILLLILIINVVVSKYCFSCENFIHQECSEQVLTTKELLECYSNIKGGLYDDCKQVIKKKIKNLKKNYTNNFIEQDEIIINNIFNTQCREEIQRFCKIKRKKKNIIIISKIDCFKKIKKHIKIISFNCKTAIQNYIEYINTSINFNTKKN